MRWGSLLTGVGCTALVLLSACAPAATVVGAGDIAGCENGDGDEKTARLLDSISGTVFTLGDNAYPRGTTTEFLRCYDRTWGRHRHRTRPALGNHDILADSTAAPYFEYFGSRAGPRGRGYYSYNVGSWHIIVLDSNCYYHLRPKCRAGSPQERWLRNDLAANRTAKCTLAYWHFPRYTSDRRPQAIWMRWLWEALYEYDAEVVLSGHFHGYERFAPQNPWGAKDLERGIRQFVVGTGGHYLYQFGAIRPHSEARNNSAYGVLVLSLKSDRYSWTFKSVDGTFTDHGTTGCH